MSVELVPEKDLRKALRHRQADAASFESGIRERIQAAMKPHEYPDQETPPLLKVAAAFLPWPLISQGKIVSGGAKLSSLAFSQKILGYIALPAISLFCLGGAAFFSAKRIHKVQKENHSSINDLKEMQEAYNQWWGMHKWAAYMVFSAVLLLPMIGSTWLMFVLLLISFASLLSFLSSFSELGIGNRLVVSEFCMIGLIFLIQAMMNPFVGQRDIHLVDQKMIPAVLLVGVLIFLLFVLISMKACCIPGWRSKAILRGLGVGICVPLMLWLSNPIWRPTTPSRIQHYVESFEQGPYPSINWRNWEIAASWAIKTGLESDLSRARQLLSNEIAEDQLLLPRVLSSAFRVGIVQPEQISELAEINQFAMYKQFSGFEKMRQTLLPQKKSKKPRRIRSLEQDSWVIYALEQSNQLSPEDRDFLEKRLLLNMAHLEGQTADVLRDALRITQLLEVIDRFIDREQTRERVHEWLREFHSTKPPRFQLAGGFERYKGLSVDLHVTSHAIELMQLYGIPDNLDLIWVRSYLRPRAFYGSKDDKWIAAVTLERLNSLPGVTHPTWFEILVYERILLVAMVLVVLCIYATLASPKNIGNSRRMKTIDRETIATD